MSIDFKATAATANFGIATAKKAGRFPHSPYVPVIDHGNFTKQVMGLAYATREEALDAAQRHINNARESLASRLAEPRHRALRRQYGLPEEIT
jgi:hypothetical protein